MARVIISILWFFIFTKLLIFWVWLWQVKEYRWRRFKAHFETQIIRKLFFSFHGIRYPKLTPKVIVILISGVLLEFLVLWSNVEFILLLILFILAPIIFSLLVLFFQIPTIILIRRTLKKAREKKEQFKNLIVIGITGSYGKSSTKEFLAEILSEKFNVLKTEKNINTEIGIAQTVLNNLKPEHQIFIAEIGAYKRGEVRIVCQMLQPKIGILTGINEQHLSTFGSLENIIKGKFELIEALPENGIAIFNGDNKFIKSNIKYQKSKLQIKNQKFCSIKEKLDIWAEDIRFNKEFVFFRVFSKNGDSADFKMNLLGRHNVINILLAAGCAKKLGMSLAEIARACLKIKPEQGGMKFLRRESPTILDSSYSANPAGVIADLEYLKIYSGRKIIIMPCLIELGKAAKEVHQRIGRKIAEVCDLAIITTKDYFKEIKEGAETGSLSLLLIEKPKEIVEKIKGFCGLGDVVLLEGRVLKDLIEFF